MKTSGNKKILAGAGKRWVLLTTGFLLLCFAGWQLEVAASAAGDEHGDAQTSAAPGTETPVPQSQSQPSPPAPVVPAPQFPAASPAHNAPAFFVMIDAGHGGDDNGARLGSKLLEKDVTLALARKIKAELQERGIGVRLMRDADLTLALEQRAEASNEDHAAAYVAIHAGTPGGGVRIYTPAFAVDGETSPGKFLPWDNAQVNYLPRSRVIARAITGALEKKNITAVMMGTSLRPLNNINAPAIAIELAADPDNAQDITDQKFQNTVAAAIAVGIVQVRAQLGGQE